ncbi:MAG: DNA polymerase-3 subunit epsilon [Psychroserpens sp.]|jgi:DNA polymerase-3 subunit epsilon
MLKSAPKFYEVAKRIVEITEDCIIVAHNSQFDYRILRTEFKRLGFPFIRKTLCTVELSKQLIPDQASYSLGKLTRALGIPVSDRHRANGDAMATVKLFKILLAKDLDKTIIKDNVKLDITKRLNDTHKTIIDGLPSITGVYYVHDEHGEIIYIGKSKNIKHRINQHLTNTSSKSRKLQLLAKTVTYEATGNELVALLKENEEIKRNKPKLNRALKRTVFTHGLYSYTDNDGYLHLNIARINGEDIPITTFSNLQSATSFIHRVVEDYQLCQKLTGISTSKTSCFDYSIKKCAGACILEESAKDYNLRVNKLISRNSYANQNMIVIDQGREIGEKSVIYIENGIFRGLGFYELNHQINTKDVLESIITPMENNRDTQHIIQSYLRRNKRTKTMII